MKKIITVLLLALPLWVQASGSEIELDEVDIDLDDKASLQRGAEHYVNHCLSCHSLKHMRYNRLVKDLEMPEAAIKARLIPGDAELVDSMLTAMDREEAKTWFVGAKPPDLSLIARAQGADWLYSYLKGFYQDESRPFGVNNRVFPDVGMPNVLEHLQGQKKAVFEEDEGQQVFVRMQSTTKGSMNSQQFDQAMTDLVNFLVYVGEPAQLERKRIGKYVILYLLLFTWVAYLLKKEYWKDID